MKARIDDAWLHSALAVNRELGGLHWQIGRNILDGRGAQGWGNLIVDRLVSALRTDFPTPKTSRE